MFDKGLLTLTDIKKTMRGLVGLYILQAFLIVGQAVSLGLVITHLWNGKPLKEQFIYIIGFLLYVVQFVSNFHDFDVSFPMFSLSCFPHI